MAVSENDTLALDLQFSEQRETLIIRPRRLQVQVASYCLHWRNVAQFAQDSRVIQVSSVEDEVHARQLLEQHRRQRGHTVRHVGVSQQTNISHSSKAQRCDESLGVTQQVEGRQNVRCDDIGGFQRLAGQPLGTQDGDAQQRCRQHSSIIGSVAHGDD